MIWILKNLHPLAIAATNNSIKIHRITANKALLIPEIKLYNTAMDAWIKTANFNYYNLGTIENYNDLTSGRVIPLSIAPNLPPQHDVLSFIINNSQNTRFCRASDIEITF